MLRLLVWAVLLCCCHGRFVVEENSLMVRSPPALKGTYQCAIASFGLPQYGGSMGGMVVYPRANKKACKDFDDFGISFRARSPVFLLVNRGDCYFTTKVRSAQKAGAAAVLIVDNRVEPLITLDTPGDSEEIDDLQDITIPSAVITKRFGDRLKKVIYNGDKVIVNLDWRQSLHHHDEL